ncbi:MAG TPA: OmpA family protein [Chryseosolibacter sp.]
MKEFIFFARHYLWLTFAIPVLAQAQEDHSYPNYVVIGAFAKHKNATNFTEEARRSNFPAKFEMNHNRNLYYVYVLTTTDHDAAIREALKLRAETKYFDSWVFCGDFNSNDAVARDVDPVTGQNLQQVGAGGNLPLEQARQPGEYTPVRTETSAGIRDSSTDPGARSSLTPAEDKSEREQAAVETPVRTSGEEVADTRPGDVSRGKEADASSRQPVIPRKTNEQPLTSEEVVGKNFYFSLFRAENHALVDGEVDAIDFENSRKMATYEGNVPVKVTMPAGKSRRISFVCQVFGYRKLQKEFDPANPAEDLYLDENGDLVVPFELVRLQKGDIAIMYNVFFFKDAAVMRPESRYEVNNLLDLLVENPDYKIRIHGHTNGNATGKIIRMGKPDNFYSLTETKEGFGSAKKLSEERAMIIRQYLVSSGISADRMQIKAWGGKRPLFDKNSARAVENVRVEIEILSE